MSAPMGDIQTKNAEIVQSGQVALGVRILNVNSCSILAEVPSLAK